MLCCLCFRFVVLIWRVCLCFGLVWWFAISGLLSCFVGCYVLACCLIVVRLLLWILGCFGLFADFRFGLVICGLLGVGLDSCVLTKFSLVVGLF